MRFLKRAVRSFWAAPQGDGDEGKKLSQKNVCELQDHPA